MLSNEVESSDLNKLSETVLENLVPGYPLLSKFFKIFGLDISQIVQACILPFGIITFAFFFYRQGWLGQILDLFASSVHIASDDMLFESVLSFLVDEKALISTRSPIATSITDDIRNFSSDGSANATANCVNFAKLNVRRRLRLEPGEQPLWFRRNGRWFCFQRLREPAYLMQTARQTITLTVLGFRTEPITELLAEALAQHSSTLRLETRIMRPVAIRLHDQGSLNYPWTKAT